jgi:hypothetical protein
VDRYDTLIIQILAGARVDAGVVGVGVCDAQAADVVAYNATARVSPSVFQIVVCNISPISTRDRTLQVPPQSCSVGNLVVRNPIRQIRTRGRSAHRDWHGEPSRCTS